MRKLRNLIYVLAAAGCLAGGGAAIAATTASAATTTVTASTAITGRDDSGNGGNWAKDAMTRVVSATLVGLHSGPECGGLNVSGPGTCYQYTGAVQDMGGTFTTDVGAFTPNQSTPGTHIAGESALSGTFFGGSASGFTFYADSNALSAARVPNSVTGDGPVGTSEWISLLFPADTGFAGDLLPGWSWSYTEPVFCGHWVDAFNNGDGNLAADGNITGISQCKISATNPGGQATQVGTSVSLQIKASTTSSDKALGFAASLPPGLSINPTSGLITGKPTLVNCCGTASVTVSDGVGSPAQTVTFSWDVTATPPPVASKLVAKDICGAYSARHWRISNVAGGRARNFQVFTLLNSGRWFADGSGSVGAGASVTFVTHRGGELKLRYGTGLGKIVTALFKVTTSAACG
jgi:hypothetical protein